MKKKENKDKKKKKNKKDKKKKKKKNKNEEKNKNKRKRMGSTNFLSNMSGHKAEQYFCFFLFFFKMVSNHISSTDLIFSIIL